MSCHKTGCSDGAFFFSFLFQHFTVGQDGIPWKLSSVVRVVQVAFIPVSFSAVAVSQDGDVTEVAVHVI